MRGSFSVPPPLRAIVLTVAVLALLGVASGCGGGDDKTTIEPTTTSIATEPGEGQASSGAQLFGNNCQSCHGPNGAGGQIGPDLQKSSVAENLAQVEKQVRNGGWAMPPFSDVLSDMEIDTVAQYVVEQIAPKG
jgi:mono/diheme cytochrome c family protein